MTRRRRAAERRHRFPGVLFVVLLIVCPAFCETAGAQDAPTTRPPESPPATPPVPALVPLPREGTVPSPAGDRGTVAPPTVTIPAAPAAVLPRAREPGVPPGATFELHPSVTLSEEYTSNFRLGESGQENFRTSLSPGGVFFINGAFVKGQMGYTLSAAHDSSRTDVEFFHAFQGSVTWAATPRLAITLSDTLSRSDDPSQADRLRLRRERELFTSNVFSAASRYSIDRVSTEQYYRVSHFSSGSADTVSHAFGANAATTFAETNSASLGYEYLITDSEGAEIRGHSINATLGRRLNELTTVGISGGLNLRSSQGARRADNDFTIANVAFFTTYTLPRLLTLSSSLGVSRLEADRGSEQISVSTSTTLSYQFAKASASIGVEQGFSETFALGEDFGVVETRGVFGSLAYPITPFLYGTGTAFYRQNDFQSGGGQRGREETTWGGTLGLSITLLRWLSMALEYGYTQGTTDGDEAFTENRARLSLSASF